MKCRNVNVRWSHTHVSLQRTGQSVHPHEHGEVLNRFLAEAGMPTNEHWEEEAKKNIPFRYTFESKIYPLITNCFGKSFSGTHMAWGAINEMTTLQGYRRLWTLAEPWERRWTA